MMKITQVGDIPHYCYRCQSTFSNDIYEIRFIVIRFDKDYALVNFVCEKCFDQRLLEIQQEQITYEENN